MRRVHQLSTPTAKTNKQWAPTREPSWGDSYKRWWALAAGVCWWVVVLLPCCLSDAPCLWRLAAGGRSVAGRGCLVASALPACACFFGSCCKNAVVGAVPRTDKVFQVSPSMFWDGSLHQKPRVVVCVVTDQMVGDRRSPGASILGARSCTSSTNHHSPVPPTGSVHRDALWTVFEMAGCLNPDGFIARWRILYLLTVRRCGVSPDALLWQPYFFFVYVAAATSASCRGTSQQNIAFQTLRRHVSRPVAAGVSLSAVHIFSRLHCVRFFCWRDCRGGIAKWFLLLHELLLDIASAGFINFIKTSKFTK